MNEQELYRKKHRARLEEWEAELDKLKAKASRASADAQLKLGQRISTLEEQLGQARERLSDLADAGEESWESAKQRVDEAWTSLKAGFEEAREEAGTGASESATGPGGAY